MEHLQQKLQEAIDGCFENIGKVSLQVETCTVCCGTIKLKDGRTAQVQLTVETNPSEFIGLNNEEEQ